MLSSNNASLNETIGVILRERNSLVHSKGKFFNLNQKGINKVLFYDEDFFFTGGRDSIIKFWHNNKQEKVS